MNARNLKKLFNNESDWGHEMKVQTMVKGKNLVVVDSFWAGSSDAMERLVTAWTTGHMAKFLSEEHGVSFRVVDTFVQMKAEGRWTKFTDNGVVGVELEVL